MYINKKGGNVLWNLVFTLVNLGLWTMVCAHRPSIMCVVISIYSDLSVMKRAREDLKDFIILLLKIKNGWEGSLNSTDTLIHKTLYCITTRARSYGLIYEIMAFSAKKKHHFKKLSLKLLLTFSALGVTAQISCERHLWALWPLDDPRVWANWGQEVRCLHLYSDTR